MPSGKSRRNERGKAGGPAFERIRSAGLERGTGAPRIRPPKKYLRIAKLLKPWFKRGLRSAELNLETSYLNLHSAKLQ